MTLDNLDLQLVHALQINPRAPFTTVASTLKVDAATVARRWERLTADNLGWVTCYPNAAGYFFGYVEVSCQVAQAEQVADQLSEDTHAVSIAHITGDMDLLVVVTQDYATFARYVAERIHRIPGVVRTRSHPFAHSYLEGSAWQLDALSSDQTRIMRKTAIPSIPGQKIVDDERPIVLALADDGRLALTDLARRTGVSVNTARRRLQRLVTARKVLLRCEIAHTYSGWPLTVIFWARADANRVTNVAQSLIKLRPVRICAITATGHSTLVFTASLRNVNEILKFHQYLADTIPDLLIIDRALVLRHVKLAGSVLDETGRRIGTVPIDITLPIAVGEANLQRRS